LSPTRIVIATLVLTLLSAPGLAAGDGPPVSVPKDLKLKATGEFNPIAGLIVCVAVVAGTFLVWILQLVIAKILVIIVPFFFGLAAAFTLPPGDPKQWIVPGLMLVALGVALALACKLYATIWDLQRAVARLERGGR
jgi:hypothetical protein